MTPGVFGIKPAYVIVDADFAPWFASLADDLLNASDFLIAGEPYRLGEIEVYYHGPGHFDVFAHRQPIQLHRGRWYFHRAGSKYRGGSFKGIDLTLGDGTSHVGILIRSIVDPQGTLVSGPSRIVDHLLAQTRMATVTALDAAIGGRTAWDATSPLAISSSQKSRDARVYDSARVGLSLKKTAGKPGAVRYIGRPYRYLTEPLTIGKGKLHLVLRLHERGEPMERIHRLTACPRRTIERYIHDHVVGRSTLEFERYMGKTLTTHELCQLLGTWSANWSPDKG